MLRTSIIPWQLIWSLLQQPEHRRSQHTPTAVCLRYRTPLYHQWRTWKTRFIRQRAQHRSRKRNHLSCERIRLLGNNAVLQRRHSPLEKKRCSMTSLRQMENLWQGISKNTRLKILGTCIFLKPPMDVRHGFSAWTLPTETKSFEFKCYWSMLEISCAQKQIPEL